MPRQKKILTQSQIAKATGVSQTTVSAILSGKNDITINPNTRDRVIQYAAQAGYRSCAGKSARKGNVGRKTILLVRGTRTATDEGWVRNVYDEFFSKLVASSERYLRQHGLALSIYEMESRDALMQWLSDSDYSGLLWHASDSDDNVMHWVVSRYPVVLLNREWHTTLPCDSVSVNQELNMNVAAEHLWSLGHRKIATFGHNPSVSFYRRRLKAYCDFVCRHGLRNYKEFQEIRDELDVTAGDKVAEILATWKRLGADAPTALVTSDVFALPLLQEAAASGIRIPEDLSIVGIDNTAACTVVKPQLSSVEEPFDEMCRLAVDFLIRRLENPQASSITAQVAPSIVCRETVSKRDCSTASCNTSLSI